MYLGGSYRTARVQINRLVAILDGSDRKGLADSHGFDWRSTGIGKNAPPVVTCRDHCSLSPFFIGPALRSHFVYGCRDAS